MLSNHHYTAHCCSVDNRDARLFPEVPYTNHYWKSPLHCDIQSSRKVKLNESC